MQGTDDFHRWLSETPLKEKLKKTPRDRTRCFWCNTDPAKAAKQYEGPHATWCPHFRRFYYL